MMRGDEWNRLVAEPTVTEVDAALAEVRVRALPIARRNARNRRAMSLGGFALLASGAFWAGTLQSGNGVTVGGERDRLGNGYRGALELVVAPGATPAPAEPSRLATWHITGWQELEGERFGASDHWVEGPPGTAFLLRYYHEGRQLEATVRPALSGDTVIYWVRSALRAHFGTSPRNLDLYEEGSAFARLVAPRGAPVLLYPLGSHTDDEPRAVLRLEGPDITAPEDLRWDSSFSDAVWRATLNFSTSSQLGWEVADRLRAAQANGVRVASQGFGLSISGMYYAPIPRLRISLEGNAQSVEYGRGPNSQTVVVPGIPLDLAAHADIYNRRLDDPVRNLCVNLRQQRPRGRQAPGKPFLAQGCFAMDGPLVNVITANDGRRLRIEQLRPPGVVY